MNYLDALRLVHDILVPTNYLEIGCRQGHSLSLARCPSVAVDPDFEIVAQLEAPVRLYRTTSDDFFTDRDPRKLLDGPVDLAFIDGMHNAEYVLRDFINLERVSKPGSVIIVDDVLPERIDWTTRERQTQAWTGDVYKFIPLLRSERPDLAITVFDIEMKGLAVITELDPGHRELSAALERHESWLRSPRSEIPTAVGIREVLEPHPASELVAYLSGVAEVRHEVKVAR